MIILDTNIVLRVGMDWKADGVSTAAEQLVVDAQVRGEAAISAATIWEIGELAEKGIIHANLAVLLGQLAAEGISVIPIDGNIAARAVQLRSEWADKDPADRFIMATALLTNSQLVTIDAEMITWNGPARVVDARS
ncbi:type II toxin-antitoxin system VapC family toxin [Candidatus Poriferisocius sp.]|uniref:type II toxin-antitoxin system VapC family toxin n=1 Tax=Candidatus Poriferisocius sp. TaxID=3101276 RepID=UPI003B516BD2